VALVLRDPRNVAGLAPTARIPPLDVSRAASRAPHGQPGIRTPVRAPKANAIAERFVGTVRRECLDWLLIANRRHLQRVLAEFVGHYNGHRPHRALGLAPPEPRRPAPPVRMPPAVSIHRHDRLGGLIHEYTIAA
jgi:transposase InsO family protein